MGGGLGGFRLLGKYRSDIFPKNRTFFLLGKMSLEKYSWPRWGQRTNRPKKCSSWKTQLGHFIMAMSALIFYRLFYILSYKDCWEKENRSNEKFVEEYWSSDYFRPKAVITGSLHNKKKGKRNAYRSKICFWIENPIDLVFPCPLASQLVLLGWFSVTWGRTKKKFQEIFLNFQELFGEKWQTIF